MSRPARPELSREFARRSQLVRRMLRIQDDDKLKHAAVSIVFHQFNVEIYIGSVSGGGGSVAANLIPRLVENLSCESGR